MMKYEFEAIAGYEVTDEMYTNVIEPMYMATNMDKSEFVKTLNKKYFVKYVPNKKKLLKEIQSVAEYLYNICGHYNDFESWDKLYNLCKDYAKYFCDIDVDKGTDYWVDICNGYEMDGYRGCGYPMNCKIGYKNLTVEVITFRTNSTKY